MQCHFLRGSVDWNLCWYIWDCRQRVTSFAEVWIEIFCKNTWYSMPVESLPSRKCGLKSIFLLNSSMRACHFLRGSVDWNMIRSSLLAVQQCHFLRGSVDWNPLITNLYCTLSRHFLRGSVDWNFIYGVKKAPAGESLPSRKCGLKFSNFISFFVLIGHFLRGSVDWNQTPNCYIGWYISHFLRGSVDWNQG